MLCLNAARLSANTANKVLVRITRRGNRTDEPAVCAGLDPGWYAPLLMIEISEKEE